jgi:hydrogenase/urease accessory protein HupE
MSRVRGRALGLAALAAALVGVGPLGADPALAHDETVSTSEVQIDEREILWRVEVGTEGLDKAIKLPARGPDLTEALLESAKPVIARYLQGGLTVEIDGVAATPEVGKLEPRYEPFVASGEPYVARAQLELRYRSPTGAPIEEVKAGLRLFAELTSQHRALVKLRWAGELKQTTKLGPTELTFRRGRLNPSRWQVLGDFLLWGTHHIFIGYDHIAFLLALLLVVGRLGELIRIVTSFTAAHTLTLLLAAFDVLRVPSRLTESLIAASIVYVAAENLLRRGEGSRRRWMLTFGFGLVHGLGFAGVLRERLLELPQDVAWPVVSFNLGVELGQLAIVALAFPLLVLLCGAGDEAGRATRRKRIVLVGSVPILLLGLFWLGTRLFE